MIVLINHLLASESVINSALEEKQEGLLERIPYVNLYEENLEKYSLLEILLYLGTVDEVIDFKKGT